MEFPYQILTSTNFGYEQRGLSESLLQKVALEVPLRQRPGSEGRRTGRGRERMHPTTLRHLLSNKVAEVQGCPH
jgi:hypothetical protein